VLKLRYNNYMKILLPTDFSDSAKTALKYALQFTGTSNVDYHLLHIAYNSAPGKASSAMGENLIMNTIISNAENDITELETELSKSLKPGHSICKHVLKDFPVVDAISNFASSKKFDLIVIGTQGASGVEKIMGTNAVGLISKNKIPTITVPNCASFRPIKKIVYASTLLELGKELPRILPFAEFFGSDLYILHVTTDAETVRADKLDELKTICIQNGNSKVEYKIAEGAAFETEVNNYIEEIGADMLAMFTHELSFFEKLFGTSVTREMAYHSKIPLLTLKKEES
jgi:nucleotide-binding universal stress UspA family protein